MVTSDDDAVNTEEKIWDLTHNINVKGVWYGCKHSVIAMRKVCLGVSIRDPAGSLRGVVEHELMNLEQGGAREGIGQGRISHQCGFFRCQARCRHPSTCLYVHHHHLQRFRT